MSKRRQFIRDCGFGAFSALALATTARSQAVALTGPDFGTGKKVRVGIIGAENSHSIGFGRMFNVQKKFPGVEVVAIWGETDEFAKNSAEKGSIPKIVKKQGDLMGMIDALIIDHRHAKYHVESAIPFIKAGIPTFVDKPFSYRTANGRQLLELAEKHKTPITCLSSVGYGPLVDDMATQVKELGDIESVVTTGPSDINSKYGGIFFYGIHTVERLFKLFGSDVEAVRATRNGPRFTFQFKYQSGLIATYIPVRGWDFYCATKEGMKQIKPRIEDENSTLYMYSAIVKMFQTGVEPRTHESILAPIAALEAMERSVSSERWEFLLV